MKWLLRLGLVVLAVVVVTVVGVNAWCSSLAQDQRAKTAARLDADWQSFNEKIIVDGASWKGDELLAPRDGGDASALLFAHVRWEGEGNPPELGDLPAQLTGPTWLERGDAGVVDLDLKWMGQLSAYGYWDLEPEGGHDDAVAYAPLTEAHPNFLHTLVFAKARLLQGLETNTGPAAARDVRELARLQLSTEDLVGEMTGVAMLGLERHAWEEALRRQLDVTGWKPVNEPDQQRLRRALWAAQAPYTLVASGELAKYVPPVGRCAGLREGVGHAHFLRGFLEDALPERYASLQRDLLDGSCHLRRARRAWVAHSTEGALGVTAKELCDAEPDGVLCKASAVTIRLPSVRALIGFKIADLAVGDWFKPYRAP